MPVGTLLCEGRPGGPDATLLAQILRGLSVQVLPVRGKYGMKNQVLMRRGIPGVSQVFGLRDHDFDGPWQPPSHKPVKWTEEVDHLPCHLGWYWERKEIENYLVDPAVVVPLLGNRLPDHAAYQGALQTARDTLCLYQAARMSLSAHRPKTQRLENAFSNSQVDSLLALGDQAARLSRCHELISNRVEIFRSKTLVDEQALFADFDKLFVPECLPDGLRFQHYLTAFSGKDLLRQLRAVLIDQGFKSTEAFVATVLEAAREYGGELASLVPEWGALREMIRAA